MFLGPNLSFELGWTGPGGNGVGVLIAVKSDLRRVIL